MKNRSGKSDSSLDEHSRRLKTFLHAVYPSAPVNRVTLSPRDADAAPSFAARTSLNPSYKIEIEANLAWGGQYDALVKTFANGEPTGVTDVILQEILRHELGHERICPKTNVLGAAMRREVKSVLKAYNRDSNEMVRYVANLVADLIVNVDTGARNPQAERFSRGMILSWYDQGAAPYRNANWWTRFLASLARLYRGRQFPSYFEVFVASQLVLIANGRLGYEKLLRPFLRIRELPAIPKREDAHRTAKPSRNRHSIELAVERISRLLDDREICVEKEWPDITRRITRILVPFLPKTPPPFRSDPRFQYNNPYDAARESEVRPDDGEEGGGSGQSNKSQDVEDKECGKPKDGQGSQDSTPPPEKSKSEKAEKAGTAQEESKSKPADKQGGNHDDQTRRKKSSEPMPGGYILTDVEWMGPSGEMVSVKKLPEALQEYYRFRAGKLPLEINAGAKLDPTIQNILSIFGLPPGRKEGSDILRSILFVLDDSGSMLAGGGDLIAPGIPPAMPWREGSPYDAAICAIYAVANWLETKTAAGEHYNINVLTFSNSSRATDWCDASHIQAKLPDAVFHPQGGGTELDVETLLKQLPEEGATLTLLISDGDICNNNAVLEVFRRPELRERNVLVMLHTKTVGDGMIASKLRENNFVVIDVRNPADIPLRIRVEAEKLLG